MKHIGKMQSLSVWHIHRIFEIALSPNVCSNGVSETQTQHHSKRACMPSMGVIKYDAIIMDYMLDFNHASLHFWGPNVHPNLRFRVQKVGGRERGVSPPFFGPPSRLQKNGFGGILRPKGGNLKSDRTICPSEPKKTIYKDSERYISRAHIIY